MLFSESDWKRLRSLHPVALERYCARVLAECAAIIRDDKASAHDRYIRLFRLIKERDRWVALAFDDLRRSTAMQKLMAMNQLGVVTAEELEQLLRRLANRPALTDHRE